MAFFKMQLLIATSSSFKIVGILSAVLAKPSAILPRNQINSSAADHGAGLTEGMLNRRR
jgi:hypothetical protein